MFYEHSFKLPGTQIELGCAVIESKMSAYFFIVFIPLLMWRLTAVSVATVAFTTWIWQDFHYRCGTFSRI